MLALGHAVAFSLMRARRGYAVEDFQRVHPSGSLGRLSRPITEMMRTGAEMRVADADKTVREVWASTGRRGRRTGRCFSRTTMEPWRASSPTATSPGCSNVET